MKFKVILLYLFIILSGHGIIIYFSLDKIHSYANIKYEEGFENGFLEGYRKYQKERWIPAPFIKKEIPIKKVNPKLKEKFKG